LNNHYCNLLRARDLLILAVLVVRKCQIFPQPLLRLMSEYSHLLLCGPQAHYRYLPNEFFFGCPLISRILFSSLLKMIVKLLGIILCLLFIINFYLFIYKINYYIPAQITLSNNPPILVMSKFVAVGSWSNLFTIN